MQMGFSGRSFVKFKSRLKYSYYSIRDLNRLGAAFSGFGAFSWYIEMFCHLRCLALLLKQGSLKANLVVFFLYFLPGED